MKHAQQICQLWRQANPRAIEALPELLDQAVSDPVRVFFRADDVAELSPSFRGMLGIFMDYAAPLGLAVVPAWLDRSRWTLLGQFCGGRDIWTWHQHGFRHRNFETRGKKYEFGPARSSEDVRADLAAGYKRLSGIIQGSFTPIFTPPWNRMSQAALDALPGLGIKAVSRSLGAKPQAPSGLLEMPVRVDLHTRKEPDPEKAWAALESELRAGLAGEVCGIMLHHEWMNQHALDYLRALVETLARHPKIKLVSMSDLLAG